MKLNLITRILTICTLSTIQITNFNIVDTAKMYTTMVTSDVEPLVYKKSNKITNAAFPTRSLLIHKLDWYTFFKDLIKILRVDLKNAGIVKEIEHNNNLLKKRMKWYVINPNPSSEYLNIIRIPIELYNRFDPENKFALIFDINTFHLQGFQWKTKWRNRKLLYYYYFNDSVVRDLDVSKEKLSIKTERYYKKLNINSDYKIFKNKKFIFNFDQVYNSFVQLTRTDVDPHERWIEQNDIEAIMLVTLEALKFREFEKICDTGFNNINSDSLNQWKNYFTEVIDGWGKSDETIKMSKTLVEEGNINNLVLSNYQELVLPSTIFHNLEKIPKTDIYHFKLNKLDLYYDESKKDQEVTYSSTSKTKYQNYAIYDFNLKRVDPFKFKTFTFYDSKGNYLYSYDDDNSPNSIPWGIKVQWGGTIIQNEEFLLNKKPRNLIYNGKTINGFAKSINFDLAKILKNQKVTHDNSWDEIFEATPCVLQSIYHEEGLATLSVWQRFGLTWYYDEKNKEYHLQLIIYQYLNSWTSWASLNCAIRIGSRITLSNIDLGTGT